jgi:DNA-binding MarR family transcriptional regulator
MQVKNAAIAVLAHLQSMQLTSVQWVFTSLAQAACKLRGRNHMAVNPYDVYLEMESAWRSSIPKRLQGMEPRILVALLKLAAPAEGISQGAAASGLGCTQWGMSKIKGKLVREKWVVVRRSTSNHRQVLMTTTPKARLAMNILEAKLAAAMKRTVPPRAVLKKGTHPGLPANARSFFDPPIDDQST